MHCPQCGLPVQVGWLNCPRCATSLISELKTCLNGVSSSLADDVSGAIGAAAAALESVDAVCQEATSGVNSLAAA
jgi:hypothetical protein